MTTLHGMVNQYVVVHVLLLVGYHGTIGLKRSMAAGQANIGTVARQAVMQTDATQRDATVGLLLHVKIGKRVFCSVVSSTE